MTYRTDDATMNATEAPPVLVGCDPAHPHSACVEGAGGDAARIEPQGTTPMVRDVRLDACRGVALWFVFLDHIPDNLASWLTLRNYGFSDATEVFVFISGYTCMMAYGDVMNREGWPGAARHALRRSFEIYLAFLLLVAAYVLLVRLIGSNGLLDETNTRVFFEFPGTAIVHAIGLRYAPVNTDILPTFVLFHLSFPVLMLGLRKSPAVVLAGSMALYVAVQVRGFDLPSWPRGEWYFNPFAWQLLFVSGAWWVSLSGERRRRLISSNIILVVAMAYLLFGFALTLGWHLHPAKEWLPEVLVGLIYPIDKSQFDPLRLLHFMALAAVAARVLPPRRDETATFWTTAAVRCGQHSLVIFCLSVLLSFAGHVILARLSGAIVMQVIVSAAGIAVLIAVASLLTRIARRTASRPLSF